MKATVRPGGASSILLALAGAIVAGIGLYFVFLRPPLLPEDIRFMQFSAAEIAAVGPRLEAWLTYVFRVLGGYALATGLLAVALAATGFRERRRLAVLGASLGGAASIGLMAAVNFAIGSDFKWPLLGCALIWALSLVAFCAEEWGTRTAVARASPDADISAPPFQRRPVSAEPDSLMPDKDRMLGLGHNSVLPTTGRSTRS